MPQMRQPEVPEPSASVPGNPERQQPGHGPEGQGSGGAEAVAGSGVGGAAPSVAGGEPRRRGRPPKVQPNERGPDSNAKDVEAPGRSVANAFLDGIAGIFGAGGEEPEDEPRPIRGTKLPEGGGGKSSAKGKVELDPDSLGEGICALLAVPGLIGELQDGFERAHWIKTPGEVRKMSVPLARYLNRLNPKQVKLLLDYMDPFLFLCGTAAVVGPCVRMEMAFREEVRAYLHEQAAPRGRSNPAATQARPTYAPDTRGDAEAAGNSDDSDASPEHGYTPRGRLDRIRLAGPDGVRPGESEGGGRLGTRGDGEKR